MDDDVTESLTRKEGQTPDAKHIHATHISNVLVLVLISTLTPEDLPLVQNLCLSPFFKLLLVEAGVYSRTKISF